jgi:hypothetical protein
MLANLMSLPLSSRRKEPIPDLLPPEAALVMKIFALKANEKFQHFILLRSIDSFLGYILQDVDPNAIPRLPTHPSYLQYER